MFVQRSNFGDTYLGKLNSPDIAGEPAFEGKLPPPSTGPESLPASSRCLSMCERKPRFQFRPPSGPADATCDRRCGSTGSDALACSLEAFTEWGSSCGTAFASPRAIACSSAPLDSCSDRMLREGPVSGRRSEAVTRGRGLLGLDTLLSGSSGGGAAGLIESDRTLCDRPSLQGHMCGQQ